MLASSRLLVEEVSTAELCFFHGFRSKLADFVVMSTKVESKQVVVVILKDDAVCISALPV